MKKKTLINLIVIVCMILNTIVSGYMTIENLLMGKNLQLGLMACVLFIGLNCIATMWLTRDMECYI